MRSGDKGQQHMLGGKKGCLFPSIPALPAATLDSTHMSDSRATLTTPECFKMSGQDCFCHSPSGWQQQGELSEGTISPELDQCSA